MSSRKLDHTITLYMNAETFIRNSVAESDCGRGFQHEGGGWRYPGRTLYVIICGLKKFFRDLKVDWIHCVNTINGE